MKPCTRSVTHEMPHRNTRGRVAAGRPAGLPIDFARFLLDATSGPAAGELAVSVTEAGHASANGTYYFEPGNGNDGADASVYANRSGCVMRHEMPQLWTIRAQGDGKLAAS